MTTHSHHSPSIYVGLDVHKDSIDFALAEAGRSGEVRDLGTVGGGVLPVTKALRRLVGTDIAWAAQLRLSAKFRRLLARKVMKTKAVVAVARELAGFVWAIGQQVQASQGPGPEYRS